MIYINNYSLHTDVLFIFFFFFKLKKKKNYENKGISISGNPFDDEVDVIYSLRNCAQVISKYYIFFF